MARNALESDTEGTARERKAMTTPTSQPTQSVISNDSRNLATVSHLSAFTVFLGLPPVVGPLVVWLLRDETLPRSKTTEE